ncbi:Uncharacterised protein [Segatella copri]|jgi:hypothetical protein|nr:Uncharacterised protein [Segatella copri]
MFGTAPERFNLYLFDIISIFLHKNNLLSLIVKNGKRLLS